MTSSSLATRLKTTSDRLDGLFNERERTFLAIGQSLGDAITEIAKVTGAFEALPNLLENNALHQATERISAIARTTNAIRYAVADENAALSELLSLNREIGERLIRLQNSVRTIAILTSNAKIEAARVEQGGSAFSNFTMEIGQLARRAQDTVDSYLNEHKRLVVLLNNVRKVQTQFYQKYHGTLLSISEELEATLTAVDARRRGAATSAVNIAARSKRINEAIGTAVMSLQISDITRQRVEHVHFAIDHLREGIEDNSQEPVDGTWSRMLSEAERDGVTVVICRLQSVQLEDALTEYEETVCKIRKSLAQLIDECRHVAHEGSEVYGSMGQEAESFLDVLKKKLGVGLDLIHDCQIARSTVTHATSVVATTVRQLQQKVSSVNQIVLDMTLVGMNAALKSRQLGGVGRGLAIIADELRNYANQTAINADALKPALVNVIGSAERLENMRLSQDGDNNNLDAELAVAMNGFDQCATKLKEALVTLSHGAKHVGKILQDSAARVYGQKNAPVALQQACLELDQLASTAAGATPRADILEKIMELISSHYTMARERQVHQQFAASVEGMDVMRAPREPAAAATPPDDADILDEILFA